jgi:hypothetical protein
MLKRLWIALSLLWTIPVLYVAWADKSTSMMGALVGASLPWLGGAVIWAGYRFVRYGVHQ